MPRHAQDYAKIGVLLAGGLEERCGRGECMPPVYGVVVKPAGIDHVDRFNPSGARMFSVRLGAAGFQNRYRNCSSSRFGSSSPVTVPTRVWT